MGAAGEDAGLPSGGGNSVDSDLVQSDGKEGDGLLFSRREENVELAFGRLLTKFIGHADQFVGHTAHRRNHGDDLIAFIALRFDALSDISNAVNRADGGAAVFLNDESHS